VRDLPAGDDAHVEPGLCQVGDAWEVPAQFDRGSKLAIRLEGAANSFGGRFVDGEHQASMRVPPGSCKLCPLTREHLSAERVGLAVQRQAGYTSVGNMTYNSSSRPLPLVLQTAYVDLLEKLQDHAFATLVSGGGSFVSKIVKGRRYWYIQTRDHAGTLHQAYVGPETPDLLRRIEQRRADADAERARRDIVRALVRGGAAPAVPAAVGRVLASLADSGVFRLRAVLVGTVAFQTYGPMLGFRLTGTAAVTEDIDLAQFRSIAGAVEDQVPPVLETLQRIDPSFRAVSRPLHRLADSYVSGGASRLKVEFLTPMRGPEEDAPVELPALGTGSQPLRYVDYLIYHERPAAILHGGGVLVNVPDPARYAWHKLIISGLRRQPEKVPKDLLQAQTLLDVLLERAPDDIADAFADLGSTGRKHWQDHALAGLDRIDAGVRAAVRDRVGKPAG
jgi:hypothetical protein